MSRHQPDKEAKSNFVCFDNLSPKKYYKHINDEYYYTMFKSGRMAMTLHYSKDCQIWYPAQRIPKERKGYYQVKKPEIPQRQILDVEPSESERFAAYIKNNLKLETKVNSGRYGITGTLHITLKLGDEDISESMVDLIDLKEN